VERKMERFTEFILKGVTDGCSDMHITGGQPVIYRKDGIIVFEKDIAWKPEEVDALVKDMLNPHQLMMLKKRYSVDFAMTIKNIRIRVNVFNTIRGLSLAVRILPGTAPTISDLNLHPSLKEIRELKFGLVLICGPTGSGKSSTITAIIEEINNIRSAHIVSLEDPIEFRYLQKKAFIEQRELSTHMPSFNQGLIDILREDPDVIVVGELREPENIRLTLNAVNPVMS
jgi:Tfp pilus assembly pilus retraction ATPase PilT